VLDLPAVSRFLKYHGLGNDFVLLDRLDGGNPPAPEQAIAACERRRGIGADGVLTVLPSELAAARMHVTNADGSVAEMCGNGLRCVARHLAETRFPEARELLVETGAGLKRCELHRHGGRVEEVTVEMGAPVLEPARIPMAVSAERFVGGEIEVGGLRLRATAVSMGNPHLVLFGLDRRRAPELAPLLERHPLFPARTNVELAEVCGDGLDVIVWERGCGFTQACGTGACAAMVAAVLEGRLQAGVERPVKLAGGTLRVAVAAGLDGVRMRGPAARVFEGTTDLI
jgi:diaminopimelate epimerase